MRKLLVLLSCLILSACSDKMCQQVTSYDFQIIPICIGIVCLILTIGGWIGRIKILYNLSGLCFILFVFEIIIAFTIKCNIGIS